MHVRMNGMRREEEPVPCKLSTLLGLKLVSLHGHSRYLALDVIYHTHKHWPANTTLVIYSSLPLSLYN